MLTCIIVFSKHQVGFNHCITENNYAVEGASLQFVGGDIGGDSVVDNHIVQRHILTSYQLDNLMRRNTYNVIGQYYWFNAIL